MNTFLKLSSTKKNQNCNCISPFYIDNISGINPNTGRDYTDDDKDILKTSLMRISNAKGCDVSICCDPNDPTSMPDTNYTSQFLQKFPKILPIYEGTTLKSIKLSTTNNVKANGWQTPNNYMICKITKSKITDTSDPTIKIATNLVTDCFTDQCNQVETITMNNLLQNAKGDISSYTYVDDSRVNAAITDGNISYVKEYIRKYKSINSPLTNDDYNNRMIHIASQSKSLNILTMLIALKANLNITNKLKETPIHFAVRSKNIDNIDALLAQGVDLTIATINGETPMFYAMKTGDMRIINMLYNNTAPILNVDKSGNNLIHYCIKNCPVIKNTDNGNQNASNSIPNTKSDIIRFLIDHGVSTEQKNVNGITPLELTSKEIIKEINKECDTSNEIVNSKINENFFNIKAIAEAFTNKSKSNSNSNKGYGAIHNNVSNYTDDHESLLEIQTMIFNNILKNNPNKFSDYISVDDIPKGSPIEILDTVCVGNGMTGNEDSDDCISKGGQIVKIKNKTTKIKLELISDSDIDIDSINQQDLYYNKIQNRIPYNTISPNINNYNNNIKNGSIKNIIPKNTGITYNIGQESTNIVNNNENTQGFNPQPTKLSNIPVIIQNDILEDIPNTIIEKKNISTDHPHIFNDDDDEIIHKCKTDAIINSTKITNALTTSNTIQQITNPQTTNGNISVSSLIQKYKTQFIILIVIIVLLVVGVIVYNFNSGTIYE